MLALLADASPLLTLSLVLIAGVLFGALARKAKLPAVTGQIVAGILLGPAVLGVFGDQQSRGLEPILDFALGLMAVAAGSHLRLRRLANAKKRLGLLLLFEVLATPALVLILVGGVGDASMPLAFLLAAISVATAPATVLALVKEARAKGVFVKTLVAGVALNNLACIALFEIARAVARAELARGGALALSEAVLPPLRQMGISALLGCGVGVALVGLTRRVLRPDRVTTMSIVAILFVAGVAPEVGVSPLLPCLFLGVTLANLTPTKEEIGHAVFANFEAAIFAAFFTLAGMELSFGYVVPGGVLALLVFGGRFGGKTFAAWAGMRLGGATKALRRYLGLALIPQAGLAVGLMLLVTEDPDFEPIRHLVLAVVLTVVLLNEIVGPITARHALLRSGEAGADRPRVIDFLHEEHIVTGLRAATAEEAIQKLADHMIRTRKLSVRRDDLLRGVLEREREGATCLGDGLAVPHGPFPGGDRIVGVMGLSRDGLGFAGPDGVPIHCMVLLATPEAARQQHLQVLAALARAVGSDRNVRDQLYAAKSPAHAYELLHVGDVAQDLNYALDA